MDKTIRVTGTGKLSLKPDTIRLAITLRETHESYTAALEESAMAAGRLQAAFSALGFEKEDLKTLTFAVSSRYDNEPDDKGVYRQKLKGFEYDYRMYLEFPRDNERLGQVLTAMLTSGVAVEFSLNYTVRDPEPARTELLQRAVRDSKKKAEGLAAAAGVELGQLMEIDYGWQDKVFRTEIMQSSRAVGAAAFSGFQPELEAADIELEESVRAVWSIL